jgi:hypothetical protein
MLASLLCFIFILAGGYITDANVKLSHVKKKDDFLNKAYHQTLTVAILTWVLTSVVIIGGIILIVVGFGSGAAEGAIATEGVVAGGEGLVVAGEGSLGAIEGGVEGLKGIESSLMEAKRGISEAEQLSKNAQTLGKDVKSAEKGLKQAKIAEQKFEKIEKKETKAVKTIEKEEERKKKDKKKKKKKGIIGWIVYIFLLVALGLVFLSGSLAASAANNISKSPNFDKNKSKQVKAYKDCIIGACLCLGSGGLIIVFFITRILLTEERKIKLKRAEKLLEKEKEEAQKAKEKKLDEAKTKINELKKESEIKKFKELSEKKEQEKAEKERIQQLQYAIIEKKLTERAGLTPQQVNSSQLPQQVIMSPSLPPQQYQQNYSPQFQQTPMLMPQNYNQQFQQTPMLMPQTSPQQFQQTPMLMQQSPQQTIPAQNIQQPIPQPPISSKDVVLMPDKKDNNLSSKNCYDNLGLKENEKNPTLINSNYRNLAKKYHPDRCKTECCEETMKVINQSKDVLLKGETTGCKHIEICKDI